MDRSFYPVYGPVRALVGPWVAGKLGLFEPFVVTLGGQPFEVLWSILGALVVAVLHLFSRGGGDADASTQVASAGSPKVVST